jgi:hypothetical protein
MAADVRDSNHSGTWRRSSRCNQAGNCVEVDRGPAGAVVRDSKSDATLPGFGDRSWSAFLVRCRSMHRH